jgi:hypothetical protein
MIRLNLEQAKQLVELFGGDEETVITLSNGMGQSGKGIDAEYSAYPEEGSYFLGQEP